ncbi:MAG: hypothetical protein C0424_11070 [Sphingobacteriaceae bacterium]|nr:hypothetical protein [Sphingobacteriaceae bacterium]
MTSSLKLVMSRLKWRKPHPKMSAKKMGAWYFAGGMLLFGLLFSEAASAQFDPKPPAVKKHEIGINPMDVTAALFGASIQVQPMSVHYKYNLGKTWLRTGIYYENFWATSDFSQRLEDSLLVQRYDQSDAWAVAASLGIEKRKPLPNNFAFTYGADVMYRFHATTRSIRELLYNDFQIDSGSSTTVQYVRNSAAIDSRDLREDLWESRQYGLRLTAGLQHFLHPRWVIHLQASTGFFYAQNELRSYFPMNGARTGVVIPAWEWQRWPLFNEVAVYYRF